MSCFYLMSIEIECLSSMNLILIDLAKLYYNYSWVTVNNEYIKAGKLPIAKEKAFRVLEGATSISKGVWCWKAELLVLDANKS